MSRDIGSGKTALQRAAAKRVTLAAKRDKSENPNLLSSALANAAKNRVALAAKRDKTEANGNPASTALLQSRAEADYAAKANAYEQAVRNNAGNQNSGGGSNNSGGSGGGGVGGVAAEVPAADPGALTPTQQSLADSIRTQIGNSSTSNQTAYDEAKAKILAQYQAAEKDRNAVYAQEQAPIQENLKNLGMDFSSTDMAKDWNKDNRYLQEAADTSLATDQAWFDKMKTNNADLYQSLLVELSQNELALSAQNAAAAAEAAGGGGGGGGGGHGGGGGGRRSSGGVTQTDTNTLTEDELFYNPVLMEAIANVADPRQREFLYSQIDLGGGQVNTALQNLAKSEIAAGKPSPYAAIPKVTNPFDLKGRIGNLTNATLARVDQAGRSSSINDILFAKDFLRTYSPNYGPIVTKQAGKTTSAQKGVTKGVPRTVNTYNAPALKPAPRVTPKPKVTPKVAPKRNVRPAVRKRGR